MNKEKCGSRRHRLYKDLAPFVLIAVLFLVVLIRVVLDIFSWQKDRQCLANTRSIHWALSVYATDNDGKFPAGQTARNAWKSGAIVGWRLPAETFRCPSADGQSPSYGYRDDIPKTDLVVKPETFAYLMDSEGPPLWSVNEDNCTVVSDGTRPWEYSTRHRGKMLVCFLGGNARWLDQAELEAILDERIRLPFDTYQNVTVGNDGAISAPNLAPGKYKLVPAR